MILIELLIIFSVPSLTHKLDVLLKQERAEHNMRAALHYGTHLAVSILKKFLHVNTCAQSYFNSNKGTVSAN